MQPSTPAGPAMGIQHARAAVSAAIKVHDRMGTVSLQPEGSGNDESVFRLALTTSHEGFSHSRRPEKLWRAGGRAGADFSELAAEDLSPSVKALIAKEVARLELEIADIQ